MAHKKCRSCQQDVHGPNYCENCGNPLHHFPLNYNPVSPSDYGEAYDKGIAEAQEYLRSLSFQVVGKLMREEDAHNRIKKTVSEIIASLRLERSLERPRMHNIGYAEGFLRHISS